jgi:hypothetical protein
MLHILRIEVDGFAHIRPWVAALHGSLTSRTFVRSQRDYANARVTGSRRMYGVVATYALRPGLYEINRGAGRKSRRYAERVYLVVDANGDAREVSREAAQSYLDGVDA